MNDVHTVNQPDQMALQDNPDFNLNYHESPHEPFPQRPFMLGRAGTALEALRVKEQSDWNNLSAEEKVRLFVTIFKQKM